MADKMAAKKSNSSDFVQILNIDSVKNAVSKNTFVF